MGVREGKREREESRSERLRSRRWFQGAETRDEDACRCPARALPHASGRKLAVGRPLELSLSRAHHLCRTRNKRRACKPTCRNTPLFGLGFSEGFTDVYQYVSGRGA